MQVSIDNIPHTIILPLHRVVARGISPHDSFRTKFCSQCGFRYPCVSNICRYAAFGSLRPVVIRKNCANYVKQLVGDEFHYLLECPVFNDYRSRYLARYYCSNPNVITFKEAMSPQSKKTMKNLAYFCKEIINFL
jgi:hypothetical protein